MQSDEELQTTLSKWPFILGDVLLVATALAISILGDWQLSNWQVASCVMSVALGASLFVLPYIVEYNVRIREEAEDRAADFRILRRHLMQVEAQLESGAARLEHLEQGLTHVAEASQAVDVTSHIQALEGRLERLEPLQKAQAEQAKQSEALASQLVALAKGLESKSAAEDLAGMQAELAALNAQFDGIKRVASDVSQLQSKQGQLDALEGSVSVLQAQHAQFVEQLERLNTAIQFEATETADAAKAAGAEEISEVSEVLEVLKPVEPKVKKARETRKRRRPETRLLQRAIEEKQDRSSEAVSRIINAKSKPKPAAQDNVSTESPNLATAETSAESVEPPVASQSEPSLAEAAEPSAVEAVTAEQAEPVVGPQIEQLPIADNIFDDVAPAATPLRQRAKQANTTVLASVFIGIGNKPYLRGSGGGLNWETGVAMEFEEIGKWRWIAPVDLDESIEIQIFRNDEGPDTTGKHVLEPGEQLELSPVF
jgi:hypothetical protein